MSQIGNGFPRVSFGPLADGAGGDTVEDKQSFCPVLSVYFWNFCQPRRTGGVGAADCREADWLDIGVTLGIVPALGARLKELGKEFVGEGAPPATRAPVLGSTMMTFEPSWTQFAAIRFTEAKRPRNPPLRSC